VADRPQPHPSALDDCNRELLALKADLLTLRPRLSRPEVPVVMFHGAKDRLVPLANVDFLERELSRLSKTNRFAKMIFPDFNHFIPWEHPEAVRHAIAWLRLQPRPDTRVQHSVK